MSQGGQPWQDQGKTSHWMWLELKRVKYPVGAQAGKVSWHQITPGNVGTLSCWQWGAIKGF